MNWLQCLVYGIVSGISEFIPISSRAHQFLLRELFGCGSQPLLDLMVHIAVLLGLVFGSRSLFEQLRREYRLAASGRHRMYNGQSYDLRFVKAAVVPLLLGTLILCYVATGTNKLLWVALFSFINGVALFAPSRMLQGNKDARSMSALDAGMTGICGALSVLPGISRVGAMAAYTAARGADRQHALNWALWLSAPALILWILVDFVTLFSGIPPVTFISFLCYLLAMAGAFAGCLFGVSAVKFLAVKSGFTGLSYYCWGIALFSVIVYLI